MFTPSTPHAFPAILLRETVSTWETHGRPLVEGRGVVFGATAVTEQFVRYPRGGHVIAGVRRRSWHLT
jgi:hypothetical protein